MFAECWRSWVLVYICEKNAIYDDGLHQCQPSRINVYNTWRSIDLKLHQMTWPLHTLSGGVDARCWLGMLTVWVMIINRNTHQGCGRIVAAYGISNSSITYLWRREKSFVWRGPSFDTYCYTKKGQENLSFRSNISNTTIFLNLHRLVRFKIVTCSPYHGLSNYISEYFFKHYWRAWFVFSQKSRLWSQKQCHKSSVLLKISI